MGAEGLRLALGKFQQHSAAATSLRPHNFNHDLTSTAPPLRAIQQATPIPTWQVVERAPASPGSTSPLRPSPVPLSAGTLARLKGMTSLFDGKTLDGWVQVPDASWTVTEGAMSSRGVGRGVIYTKDEDTNYRLVFSLRHVGGPPKDHLACVLIFCSSTPPGQKGLDALGGIQFQPPNGESWDYRPGKNNSGKGLFTRVLNPGFNPKEWFQVELLVNADAGTARMAVAQPVGSHAVEVLRFKDPIAGKKGPIAWQMHNQGLFDEFKDVRIELDPKEDRLITVESP
jgi:hypothetical protein